MSKLKCDILNQLNINDFHREGWLTESSHFDIHWSDGSVVEAIVSRRYDENYQIRLMYSASDVNHDYSIDITSTPCNYGGHRYWMHCPIQKRDGQLCGNRVAILYYLNGSFGCRQCHDLTYVSKVHSKGWAFGMPLEAFYLESRMERLMKKIKRPYYRNKPTRKQRALNKLLTKYEPYGRLLRGML